MINFRLATAEDADPCAAIYRPYVENTAVSFEVVAPSPAEIERRISEYTPRFPWIVAQAGGEIIGYTYASSHSPREAYQWNAELAIYLSSNSRGRGLGKILYSCLLELLKLQGYCQALAVVTYPNPASEALHLSLGFEVISRWTNAGYKCRRWNDVQWFRKVLLPAADNPPPPRPVTQLDGDTLSELFKRYELLWQNKGF